MIVYEGREYGWGEARPEEICFEGIARDTVVHAVALEGDARPHVVSGEGRQRDGRLRGDQPDIVVEPCDVGKQAQRWREVTDPDPMLERGRAEPVAPGDAAQAIAPIEGKPDLVPARSGAH